MSHDTEMTSCLMVFQSLASQCERMNSFARSLRNSRLFAEVNPGTDLRFYESGWVFEKYVEALLDSPLGLAAVWWFELSEQDGNWRVQATTSISHGDYDQDTEDRIVSCPRELTVVMQTVVLRLIESFREGEGFRTEIDRLLGCGAQGMNPADSEGSMMAEDEDSGGAGERG